jgi:hypothetical protein
MGWAIREPLHKAKAELFAVLKSTPRCLKSRVHYSSLAK